MCEDTPWLLSHPTSVPLTFLPWAVDRFVSLYKDAILLPLNQNLFLLLNVDIISNSSHPDGGYFFYATRRKWYLAKTGESSGEQMWELSLGVGWWDKGTLCPAGGAKATLGDGCGLC